MDNTFGDYAFVHFNSHFNSLFFNFLFTPHRVLCRRAVICLPLCVTNVSR